MPKNPSSAGRSVSAATTVNATAIDAANRDAVQEANP